MDTLICGLTSPQNTNRGTNRIKVDNDGNMYVSVSGTTSDAFANNIFNGQKTVTSAGTAEELTSISNAGYISISYLSTNSGDIYIGSSSVDSSNGYILNYDNPNCVLSIDDLSKIYIDSQTNGEGVSFSGGYFS